MSISVTRPAIKMPFTGTEMILEAISSAGILYFFAFTVNGLLEARFSASARTIMPVFVLLVMLLIYTLLTAMRLDPSAVNYPWLITENNARPMYRVMCQLLGTVKAEMMWFINVTIPYNNPYAVPLALTSIVVFFSTCGFFIYRLNKARKT